MVPSTSVVLIGSGYISLGQCETPERLSGKLQRRKNLCIVAWVHWNLVISFYKREDVTTMLNGKHKPWYNPTPNCPEQAPAQSAFAFDACTQVFLLVKAEHQGQGGEGHGLVIPESYLHRASMWRGFTPWPGNWERLREPIWGKDPRLVAVQCDWNESMEACTTFWEQKFGMFGSKATSNFTNLKNISQLVSGIQPIN